jgi:hypothetical protein
LTEGTTTNSATPAAERGRAGRSRSAWSARGAGRPALLVGAALVTAALLGACGGSSSSSSEGKTGKSLDVARVQLSIEESILRERHLHAKVTCPTSIEQRKGNNFTCYATGTVTHGHHTESFRTPFEVEQVNSLGSVYYHS